MKKITIKQSVLCNIMAGVSMLFAAAIFVSGVVTSQLFIKVTDLNKQQTQIYSHMRSLVSSVNYTKDAARSFSQAGAEFYLEMYNGASSGEKSTDNTIKTLQQLVPDPKGQEQLGTIVTHIETLMGLESQAIDLIKSNKLEAAQSIIFGQDYGMTLDSLSVAINEFEMGMEKGIGTIIKKLSDTVIKLGITIMCLCILLIIGQIINTIITKKRIIDPIVKLKNSMLSMDEGHLSGTADVDVDITEIGTLAGAMYSMRGRIDEYIKEISYVLHCISQKNIVVDVKNEYVGDFASIKSSLLMIIDSLSQSFDGLGYAADGILNSTQQVSNAAMSLADGAVVQENSVGELCDSINRISQELKNTAENAETAKILASTSEENLNGSNQQMSHMVQAISEIKESSSQIGKIIKTIEDIAFQTNILALNAAVEAARAGAAGKGFAVVADEVRSLATKSSEAAKQTNVLIENSVRSVQKGVQIADKTANALSEVVESSQVMAELVSKISTASSEQAMAITQINSGVEQISAVIQANSATSEESNATSQELSNQAQVMKNLISSFKTKSSVHGMGNR